MLSQKHFNLPTIFLIRYMCSLILFTVTLNIYLGYENIYGQVICSGYWASLTHQKSVAWHVHSEILEICAFATSSSILAF